MVPCESRNLTTIHGVFYTFFQGPLVFDPNPNFKGAKSPEGIVLSSGLPGVIAGA
jgi:hypothetical protein